MNNIWNYLYNFMWEKPLTSCSIDELNAKLREIEVDNHIELIERSFDVHRSIIRKLKEENETLKKELQALRLDNKNIPNPFLKPGTELPSSSKVPYPDLLHISSYVKWSGLQFNLLESRIFEHLRNKLVDHNVELEIIPWQNDVVTAQPVFIFCPVRSCLQQDVNNALSTIAGSSCRPSLYIILIVLHDRELSTSTVEPLSEQILTDSAFDFPCKSNIQLTVDFVYHGRRLHEYSAFNDNQLGRMVDLLYRFQPISY